VPPWSCQPGRSRDYLTTKSGSPATLRSGLRPAATGLLDVDHWSSLGTLAVMTGLSGDLVARSYLGGMRWWPNLGRLESPDATWPFARLTLSRVGVTGGPSSSLVPLVPTLTYRWEDLTVVEALTWFPVPFIASGVRFRTSDAGFIFWTGSSRRSSRILDFCDASAPGLVSRERQRAPIYGSG
jgi:hypothetical protein